MSVMHKYTVEVTESSELSGIKQILDDIGLGITREWDTGFVGKDAKSPAENLPSAGGSVRLDTVKKALKQDIDVLDTLEYEMREDTGGRIKKILFTVQDGEFIEKSSNEVRLG